MSERTKMYRTKSRKTVLCVSEQGSVYKLPQTVLNKYTVNRSVDYVKARKMVGSALEVVETDPFEDINKKYTKMGALLKAVRLREGLNQQDFARLINVTQGDLSKMERGVRPIGKLLITRIAKKFGSTLGY